MLTEVAGDLWEATQPLRVAGFDLGHRMTVIRLSSGELVVHSPVAPSTEIVAALQRLGQVHYIIAPSSMHDLYLREWMHAWPKAQLLHSPALKLKGLDPTRTRPLGREPLGELQPIPIDGMPKIQETAFLHRPTRTLIICDLVFNLPPGRGLQKLFQKMSGIYERLAPSKFFKYYISYDEAFRTSARELLRLDFDRLIVGHGSNIETNGRTHLQHAFAWLRLPPEKPSQIQPKQ